MTRNPSILADCIGQLAWMANSVHQAHHLGETVGWRECKLGLCDGARRMVERLERVLRAELEPLQSTSHATVEQLITETKLRGSALSLRGTTTPEGWPYHVLVAVESPGNEALGQVFRLVESTERRIAEMASSATKAEKP